MGLVRVLVARFWCGFWLIEFDAGFDYVILMWVLIARFGCRFWLREFGAGFGLV